MHGAITDNVEKDGNKQNVCLDSLYLLNQSKKIALPHGNLCSKSGNNSLLEFQRQVKGVDLFMAGNI